MYVLAPLINRVPQISGGSPDLHKDYEEFKLGVPLFSGIKVVMTTGGGGSSNYIQGEVVRYHMYRLGSCRLRLVDSMHKKNHDKT